MSHRSHLIVLRHGESALTADGKFAGWTDVELSNLGREEAVRAAQLLEQSKTPAISVVYTSVLQRSIVTAKIIIDYLNQHSAKIEEGCKEYRTWQLNERCYGQLEGKNKKECSKQYGTEQVRRWRRSFTVKPPQLDHSDPRWPGNNPLFASLALEDIPAGEAPIDVEKRVRAVYDNELSQHLRAAETVMVIAHGTSLRCLMKILEGLSIEELERLEIPSCVPIVYEIDSETLAVVKKEILVSEEELARRAEEIRQQSELERHNAAA